MRPHRFVQRQRGIALVTAMLITALAVTAVTSLFWQQQVQVQMLENQRLHVQSAWLLRAGLDWTRQVLRSDAENTPELTTLDGAWNRQPPGIQLDRYLDQDADAAAAAPASIGSRIVDAQSRYNLSNLAAARTLNLAEIGVYGRLLLGLGLDPSLAWRAAQAVAAGQPGEVAPAGRRQAALSRVDELLSVPGYTPQILARLQDLVVVLPAPAALNLNTAPPLVLAAVTGLDPAQAKQLAERRRQAYFRTMEEFKAALPDARVLEGLNVGLRSDYFLVESRVKLERSALDSVSLMYRPRGGVAVTELVWTREE
ncbi:type II secretion system minor pseudopilin GspK [Duganella sp. FT109W]|uniref:Type II secretion system protein K n=1 Tax=Duganella margarita TaxID=2692170 RepID=A0ABW9WEB2_9BURK|nr:type II secretion system minor pseudopilin GspK [Duganella margarita]